MEATAENDNAQEIPSLREIQDRFDQTLSQHLDRLLGAPRGIENLPLNLQNVGCIVLLAERETEIDLSPDNPLERYTLETLIEEASDLVVGFADDLPATIQQLKDYEYIQIGEDSIITAGQLTITMSQLLDRLFPKMPGLNFVAYLSQTMNEALEGTKELDWAVSQFDQTLHYHGTALIQEASQPEVAELPAAAAANRIPSEALEAIGIFGGEVVDKAFSKTEEGTQEAKRRLQEYAKKIKVSKPRMAASGSREVISQPEVVPLGQFSFQNLSQEQTNPPAPPETGPAQEIPQAQESPTQPTASRPPDQPGEATPPPAAPEEQDPQTETAAPTAAEPPPPDEAAPQGEVSPVATESIRADNQPVAETRGEYQSVAPDLPRTEAQDTGSSHDHDRNAPLQTQDLTDEAIQQKIAAFEEDLASVCPACKEGTVRSSQTAKGKIFYACDNTSCNLISWGRPYHMNCPRCHSPFLVEAKDSDGTNLLKCPRVTCLYRAVHPVQDIDPVKPELAVNAPPPAGTERKPAPLKRKVVRKVAVKGRGQGGGKKKVRKVIVRKK